MRRYCFLKQSPWGEPGAAAAGPCVPGGAAGGSSALLEGHCPGKRFQPLSVLQGPVLVGGGWLEDSEEGQNGQLLPTSYLSSLGLMPPSLRASLPAL